MANQIDAKSKGFYYCKIQEIKFAGITGAVIKPC